MDSSYDGVVANIRGCLISTKGACDIRQLIRDYRMLMGCDIPYKKFGFKSLEDFLQNVPTLLTKKTESGFFVDAKPSEKTNHIADMVARQKTTKKKTTKISTKLFSKVASTTRMPTLKWRPKKVTTKWRTSYTHPTLPESHNQFVAYHYEKKSSPTPAATSTPTNLSINNNKPTSVNKNIEANCSGSTLNKSKYIIFDPDVDTSSSDSNAAISSYRNVDVSNEVKSLNGKVESITVQVSKNSSANDRQASLLLSSKSIKFQTTGDTLVDLYAFLASKSLGDPDFKVITRKMKGQKNFIYDCVLKIQSKTYSSYPKDFTNEIDARQYTAKLALEELIKDAEKEQFVLLSTEGDVLARIPPIVEKHFHGIWSWQLEADYLDLFQEQLPKNWLEVVDMSPCISVEPCLNDRFVLRFCKPEEKGKMTNRAPLASDLSVPSNTVRFNDNGTLDAQITCVISAKEIWCRQLGTPEANSYSKLVANLSATFKPLLCDERVKASSINVGGYYVASLEDDIYARVRVLEMFDSEVSCFLIDFGDEVQVGKDKIYQMQREFAKDQAQAFICRLDGLEELYEVSYLSDALQTLLGKTVYIERPDETKTDESDPVLSVIMYNQNNECINQKLITQIAIESATPLLQIGNTYVVHVSNIENNGDLYVQILSPGYWRLLDLLAEINETLQSKSSAIPQTVPTKANSGNRLYLAKFEDEQWYRVRIIDWAPNLQHCQLYFVDYGNTTIVNVQKELIYCLDDISDVISQYPEQAIKVRMKIEQIPVDFVRKLQEILPTQEEVTLKCIHMDAQKNCVVELYKRSDPSNILFAVSQCIVLENELNAAGDHNTQSTKLQRLMSLNQFEDSNKNVPSSGSLRPPEVPKLGDYFDVVIPFAVNPWNFFVQPYNERKKLAKLMAELQKAYANVQYSPLQIEDIQHGKIYASRHNGKWYRTSVIKVIHSGSISVFYCDFGYYANLTLQQLIPLDVQFLELPYQAIKAKLSHIKPKQDKWTMEDCKFFEQLVLYKSFVSTVKAIEKDELYRCDTVLILELIDTSTDTDIIISDVLMQQNIAVEK